MSGRLKEIDWKTIVAEGKPWKDSIFPFGKHALFIDHKQPAKGASASKQKWVDNLHWKRASEYFGEGKFKVFDGVDPGDVIMGNLNNCYALAALASMSEALNDE